MPAPRIIAKDYSGAIRFAREVLELHPNTVRVVTSVGGLAGYGYTLHLAPGWRKNHAIHSINSRLRFKRGIEVIDHEAEVEKEPTRKVEDAPDISVVDSNIEPTGEWDALVEKMADEGHNPVPAEPEETDAPTGTPEPSEDAEGAEKPVQRRRRRCKKCGELVEPDDVEAHAAQHEEE